MAGSPYRASLSFDTRDQAWDALVSEHGGHYKQSSAWAEVKREYDPDNLFRLNQNIPPADGS